MTNYTENRKESPAGSGEISAKSFDPGVSSEQRFSHDRPCPVCGGGQDDPPGRGKRCWGYLSADKKYAYCTRPEYAGTLEIAKDFNGNASAWVHYLAGPCRCGVDHRTGEEVGNVGELAIPGLDLPNIFVGDRQLRDISDEALNALREANDPPAVFVRGGRLVRADSDENNRPFIQLLDVDALRGRLTRCTNFMRQRGKNFVEVPPPLEVVRDILSLGKWPGIPALEAIVEAPVLRPDGTILNAAGYDPTTRLIYHPDPALKVPVIPDVPTAEQVSTAFTLINEVIMDFPFVDESHHANALGLLLTPALRPAISGCIPLALLDAPALGTGKSLFASVVSLIATGRSASIITEAKDDEEWRKRISAALLAGSTIVALDNIERRLESASLAAVLTTDIWSDRLLGTNELIRVPNRATWIATGNNLRLGADLPRRCYWIRIDAGIARPWMRTNFQHMDLLAWVGERRGDLLAALLTLARAWFAAGQPVANVPRLGSFEEWARIVGGVLAYTGVAGFLGNLDEMYEQADETSDEWETFLRVWYAKWENSPKTTGDIVDAIQPQERWALDDKLRAALPTEFAGYEKGTLARKLSWAFRRIKDKRFAEDGLRLERLANDKHTKAAQWRVVMDDAFSGLLEDGKSATGAIPVIAGDDEDVEALIGNQEPEPEAGG